MSVSIKLRFINLYERLCPDLPAVYPPSWATYQLSFLPITDAVSFSFSTLLVRESGEEPGRTGPLLPFTLTVFSLSGDRWAEPE